MLVWAYAIVWEVGFVLVWIQDIRLSHLFVIWGREVPSIYLGANNNKEVNFVNKTDKPFVVVNINIFGNNNKLSANETRSHVPAALVIFAISIAAILVVSYCCPELLPDLVRWMIGKVVNS